MGDFTNCVGAFDRKCVTIQAPLNNGSQFHNSIIELAIVDSSYCFRMIDVGAYGKSSDGGTRSSSAFNQSLHHDALLQMRCAPPVATHFAFVSQVLADRLKYTRRGKLQRHR